MASESASAVQLKPEEITAVGVDAYIYGYPLVTMETTRRVMTNVAKPEGKDAPMGQFAHLREYPNAQFRDVTAPNADTLYSVAWLDLSKEPYIFSIPDADGRYFLMPMLSGFTDVFQVPGARTTGTKPQTYAITGPGWSGALPEGVQQYKSPTALVWILGRTYSTGTKEDYAKVHAFQNGLSLVPLSAYGKDYVAPAATVDNSVDTKTAVRDQVHALSAVDYFTLVARLLKDNPPAAADSAMVATMAKLGLKPGEFDQSKLGADALSALKDVPQQAVKKIFGHFANAGKLVNGWTVTTETGEYGTNYLQRAMITAFGLGANRPQDAIYPTAKVDADGKEFSGANKYVLHFAKGQTPPVKGFWSLTMYDEEFFFVENPINRYTVSSRFDFKYNDDGSLDIYIQKDSPGADKEANWLPAPAGQFILMNRMYWPEESVISGKYELPPVRKST